MALERMHRKGATPNGQSSTPMGGRAPCSRAAVSVPDDGFACAGDHGSITVPRRKALTCDGAKWMTVAASALISLGSLQTNAVAALQQSLDNATSSPQYAAA